MSRSPVTRKSKKPFLKFDADAFERDLVDGEVGLYRALEYLRKTVASGGTCDAISALLAVESNIKLLEYALSGMLRLDHSQLDYSFWTPSC